MRDKIYQVAPTDDIEAGSSWASSSVEVKEFWSDVAVEAACKIFNSEHDGWEWLKDGTRFLVRELGSEIAEEYEVSIDYDPVYCANKVD